MAWFEVGQDRRHNLRSEPDPANLEHFGRGRNQHGESKLCLARAVFLTLGGVILTLGLGSYKTSELTLAIQMLQQMPPQCLLLGDALFSNYLNLSLVQAGGSYVIFGKHASRKGVHLKRLGYKDDLHRWIRPNLSQTCFASILLLAPLHLDVRVITRTISRRGWRSYTLTIYTTLLDPKKYPAHEIVEIYLKRWQIEICHTCYPPSNTRFSSGACAWIGLLSSRCGRYCAAIAGAI